MKFDDEYRAGVVVMLQAEGYPDDEFALGRVHNYLKQKAPYPTKPTLMNWFKGTHNPPPLKILNEKKGNMVEAVEAWAWVLIEHATKADTVSEMSGQQLATSFGILVDKLQLLRGNPTAISESRNANLNFNVETALPDNAGNILKQLADLGAIPPAASQSDNNTTTE